MSSDAGGLTGGDVVVRVYDTPCPSLHINVGDRHMLVKPCDISKWSSI